MSGTFLGASGDQHPRPRGVEFLDVAEADQLCEQLAIVLSGRIIASGTPAEIRGEFSETTVLGSPS